MIVSESRIYIGLVCFLLLLSFSSCIDETFTNNNETESTFISIRGIGVQGNTHLGTDPDDYIVETLRVLAFDKTTKDIVTNVRYTASEGDIIRHTINPGTYDFVFLANEPANIPVLNQLKSISNYCDLDNIAYPERFFTSDQIIPMKQEIKQVTVLSNGQGARLSDNTEVTILQLALERLAVRIDVVLESDDELEDIFSGLIFQNIPDAVPLTANYQGAIGQSNIRTFKKDTDGSYFSAETPTEGRVWAKRVSRIILPAKELEVTEDKAKAVVLTVDMGNHYSPSCELKIVSEPVNYSLPINTMLSFKGIVKEPLEVNIKASKWTDENNNWNIDDLRILNVSHTKVSITDFNGARISFSSNMPVVRVLPEVYNVTTGEIVETNRIFNSLVAQSTTDWTTAPERFMYAANGQEGTGYMDLLADGWLIKDEIFDYIKKSPNLTGTYKLTLSAENTDGSNALQRDITVTIEQNGTRLQFYHPAVNPANGATGYAGAFWKNDQCGERIITGQLAREGADAVTIVNWSARVDEDPDNMVILSTTPSFDPNVGTANPGVAENFRVTPNLQKGEDGKNVSGKGRIYFRIGLTETNPDPATPRYATVKLRYWLWGWGDQPVEATLYLRQGETPDYLYPGRVGSRKFAVYNMTHKDFLATPMTNDFSIVVNRNNASEVDFPTKAGAHFQWGRLKEGDYGSSPEDAEMDEAYNALGYRALNPHPGMNAIGLEGWGWSYYKNYQYLTWDNGIPSESYSTNLEICPEGYHRPNDGSITGGLVASHNSTTTEAEASEWRASIFKNPMTGDGNQGYKSVSPESGTQASSPSYYAPVTLPDNMTFGFYADGYFDRRPIEQNLINGDLIQYGVTIKSANAAYWGCIFFNGVKSLFFPSAGRRNYGVGGANEAGVLEHPSAGFYMTASAADIPEPEGADYVDWSSVWNIELSYEGTAPVSTSFKNGLSLRCVRNK